LIVVVFHIHYPKYNNKNSRNKLNIVHLKQFTRLTTTLYMYFLSLLPLALVILYDFDYYFPILCMSLNHAMSKVSYYHNPNLLLKKTHGSICRYHACKKKEGKQVKVYIPQYRGKIQDIYFLHTYHCRACNQHSMCIWNKQDKYISHKQTVQFILEKQKLHQLPWHIIIKGSFAKQVWYTWRTIMRQQNIKLLLGK
jgi:hypothetical protein